MPVRCCTSRRTTSTLVVALVVVLLARPASAQLDPREQRETVRRQAADVAAQVDALRADQAEVVGALDALQANVNAVDADLAGAQAVAEQALAALNEAIAAQQVAERRVADLRATLRAIAIDTYVNAGTVALHEDPVGGDYNSAALRDALAGFKAARDQSVLEQLKIAQRDLDAKRVAAESASASAEARRAELETRAGDARAARNQQATFVRSVQARLDNKLSEARGLAALDKKFSAQIEAEARNLASRVAPPNRPPPPPGDYPVPPRPSATPKLATTRGITVSTAIVEQLSNMLDAATADGLKFTGSGYRGYDSQVALRRQNCGSTNYDIYYRPSSECWPATARPGYSMHEQGLAIDFAESGSVLTSHADAGWRWLNANAAGFGFSNLDSEPWHWSTNGT